MELSDKEMRLIYDALRLMHRKYEHETETLLQFHKWTEAEQDKIVDRQSELHEDIESLCSRIQQARVKIPKVIVEHEEQ